jgi:hypothetical protein
MGLKASPRRCEADSDFGCHGLTDFGAVVF